MPLQERRSSGWQCVFVLVIVTCILAMVSVLAVIVWKLEAIRAHVDFRPWMLAIAFVLVTLYIVLRDIVYHLIYFTKPDLQKPIFRILWLVPICSLSSWCSLLFPKYDTYFDVFRELYEAYSICNFMILLINYLAPQHQDSTAVPEDQNSWQDFLCSCCVLPTPPGEKLIFRCKQAVSQYTAVRLISAVVISICRGLEVYHEGEFHFNNAWIYITFVNTISQWIAMLFLYTLCHKEKDKLRPLGPFGKLMCIKFTIFFTFWQGVTICILAKRNILFHVPFWEWESEEALAAGIQDVLVCIEMYAAAIAQHFAFSYEPYISEEENISFLQSLWSAVILTDLKEDIIDQMRHLELILRGLLKPSQSSTCAERDSSDSSVPPTEQRSQLGHVTLSIPEVTDSANTTDSTVICMPKTGGTSAEGSVAIYISHGLDGSVSLESVTIAIPEGWEGPSTNDNMATSIPQQPVSSCANNSVPVSVSSNSSD